MSVIVYELPIMDFRVARTTNFLAANFRMLKKQRKHTSWPKDINTKLNAFDHALESISKNMQKEFKHMEERVPKDVDTKLNAFDHALESISKNIQKELKLMEETVQTSARRIAAIQEETNFSMMVTREQIQSVKTEVTETNDKIKSVNTDVTALDSRVHGIADVMVHKGNLDMMTKCLEYIGKDLEEKATKDFVNSIATSCSKTEAAMKKMNANMDAKMKELKTFMAEVYVEGETVGWMQDDLYHLESQLKDLTSEVRRGKAFDDGPEHGHLEMRNDSFSVEECLEEDVWRHLMREPKSR